MNEGLFVWKPELHSPEENKRWIWLRAMEWQSYPTFLAPLYGPFFVMKYGWINFIILNIILTFVWKIFVMKSFVNTNLMSFLLPFVNLLKWPLSLLMTIYAFNTHRNVILIASILFFPFITYLFQFLEIPYMGKLSEQAEQSRNMQLLISNKLGYKMSEETNNPV